MFLACVSPFGIEDAEHAFFGAGEHGAGIDTGFVRLLDDVGTGVDQRAEDGFIADDAGVVFGVGGGGDFLRKLEQEGGAADVFVLAGVFEELGEQHGVDLPAAFVEGEHVTEDGAVGGVVEVFGADEEGDFIADFGQQEQAADEGPLSFDAARGLAIEKLADFGGGFCAACDLPWPQVRSVGWGLERERRETRRWGDVQLWQ